MKRKLFWFLILYSIVLIGCSNQFSSISAEPDKPKVLIVASEKEVLKICYEAISRQFPSANINQLGGFAQGFSWFHMPMLDRTDFKLTITKRQGELTEGGNVIGYSYNISTHGTQGLVMGRYVNPLVDEITKVIQEHGIKTVNVVKFISIQESDTDSSDRQGKKSLSSGTGFFISNVGHIITNYHVVENSNKITVITNNGKSFQAELIKFDQNNDVALLKINYNSAPLGIENTSKIIKGSEIFTLGFPSPGIQGQEQKATFGRINAFSGIKGDIRFFQIDVPIQPGNSGGPLLSENGMAIGIVTAKLNDINVLRATGSLPQVVNYALKSEYLLPLIQFANIPKENISGGPAINAIKNPAILEISVVNIICN